MVYCLREFFWEIFSRGSSGCVSKSTPCPWLLSQLAGGFSGGVPVYRAVCLGEFFGVKYSLGCLLGCLSSPEFSTTVIINDGDEDFGEICVPDLTEESQQVVELPSQKIGRGTLAHVSPKQQRELLRLLDRYADRFSDIPGLTTRVEHCVCLLYTSPSPRDGLLSRMPSSA